LPRWFSISCKYEAGALMKVAAVLLEGLETLENNLAFVHGGPFAY